MTNKKKNENFHLTDEEKKKTNERTCSAEVVFTISCRARTETACSRTNTHDARSGQQTLN